MIATAERPSWHTSHVINSNTEAVKGNTNNDKQITEYEEAFHLFDRDGDGQISINELGVVMRSLGQNPSDAELHDMINEVDVNRSGAIEFLEFLAMMSHKTKEEDYEREILEAFMIFDRDEDGFISVDELRRTMSTIGENITDDELGVLIREVDIDFDGRISYEDFVELMT
ncbi:hypothetical protein FSARC_11671 [Fusarium sarcochroum]|uniref:Calmodulin n=1 Tax=Fusarium sarcochroum TaxID=1208366 RepID=A0A8H4TE64_9HYPO|nr:hypothetical protein FSARC_11671 [Fusarium sarcochroum]